MHKQVQNDQADRTFLPNVGASLRPILDIQDTILPDPPGSMPLDEPANALFHRDLGFVSEPILCSRNIGVRDRHVRHLDRQLVHGRRLADRGPDDLDEFPQAGFV